MSPTVFAVTETKPSLLGAQDSGSRGRLWARRIGPPEIGTSLGR